MFSSKARKQARMRNYEGGLVSERSYNAILGLTVLYGIIANVIICRFFTNFALHMNPLLMLVGYVVLCLAGVCMAHSSTNVGVSFLAYNMIVLPMGLVLSTTVYSYGGLSALVVIQAFNYTLIITAAMIGLSILFPAFFSRIGGILFGSLIGLLLSGIITVLIFRTYPIGLSYIGAIIFSLYIGYDFWKAQQFPKTATNAIACAVDIYLDMINLFLNLLRILGNSKKNN